MIKPSGPIKRSEELIKLSRDHHQGLLLAWKINTGIRRNVDPKRIQDYVLYFFDHEIAEHFRQEEDYVFPLLEDHDEKKQEVLRQHREIYQEIDRIRGMDPAGVMEALTHFGTLMKTHIRFEERVVFPHIETTAPHHRLKKAAEEIDKATARVLPPPLWNDEFWTRSKSPK